MTRSFRYGPWPLLGLAVAAAALVAAPATGESAQATPDVDAVLDALADTDPTQLNAALETLRAQANRLEQEAAALRKQADQAEQQATGIARLLEPVLGMAPVPKGPDKARPAMAEDGKSAAPEVTFVNDILPIFEARCSRCHNDDRRRGGLSLATFNHAMEGGSSGQIIEPGNAGGSRIIRLVTQSEEPKMPPKGNPLDAEQLKLIEEWITLGAPRDAGSEVMVAKKTTLAAPEDIFVAADLDGPPPMPEVALAAPKPARDRAVVARAMATSRTAPLAAVGGDRQVFLYGLDEFALLGALPFPEGDVYSITFSLNGQLLLVAGGQEGAAGAAVLYDVRDGKRISAYGKAYDTILAADISPDHRMIATGGPDRKVRVYATETGEELYELGKHTDWVYTVKFSPDGELLASADRAGNLLLWQASNGRPVEPLRGHNGAIHDLAYTYDSNILASAGADGRIFYWDTWKYRAIRNFKAHGGAVFSVDFNREGHLVSSGQDGLTKRWDLNGKELGRFDSLGDWAYQAAFTHDNAAVLSGDWGGEIVAWKADTKERLATLTTNPEPQDAAASVQVAANDGRGQTETAASGGE